MREPEGIATPLPGTSSEGPWSRLHEPHFRNVEAEGSSPFTSTKSPGQRAKVGTPKMITFSDVTYVTLLVGANAAERHGRPEMGR